MPLGAGGPIRFKSATSSLLQSSGSAHAMRAFNIRATESGVKPASRIVGRQPRCTRAAAAATPLRPEPMM